MPPIAAAMGTTALRMSRRWPETSSLLISMPTTKKNTAMRPSLTQWPRLWWSSKPPRLSVTSMPHTASYVQLQGEFAQSRATTVQARRTMPAAGSILRNSAAGRPT